MFKRILRWLYHRPIGIHPPSLNEIKFFGGYVRFVYYGYSLLKGRRLPDIVVVGTTWWRIP